MSRKLPDALASGRSDPAPCMALRLRARLVVRLRVRSRVRAMVWATHRVRARVRARVGTIHMVWGYGLGNPQGLGLG